MEQEPPQEVRVTDKRGQGTRASVPVEEIKPLDDETRAALNAAMAEQAAAASKEDNGPIDVETLVICTLDSAGALHLLFDRNGLAEVMSRGVNAGREATPVDIINMANQWHMTVLGREVAGQVMQGLHNTAQQAVLARANGGTPGQIRRG